MLEGVPGKPRCGLPVDCTTALPQQASVSPTTLVDEAVSIIRGFAEQAQEREQPVIRLRTPEQLYEVFDSAGAPLPLSPGQAPLQAPALLSALRQTLRYSANTSHPLFFNQLYARPDPVALVGEWAASAAHTNVHTYEVAPAFTLIEREVLARMARCVGWDSPPDGHDGIFVPGGSIANLYGLLLARHRADPAARRRGAHGGPRLVAFASEQAHYSVAKAVAVAGVGLDNLARVPCDERGRMRPDALAAAMDRAAADGAVPFLVCATAGTTVAGAFDDVGAVADVCARHGAWLHVDGSWGASALLSRRHRALLSDIARADSLTWSPHKMLGMPMQCSAFLTRHAGALAACNAEGANYLFQHDKLHAAEDLGDKTIQCGRRADAFKLWLAWKAIGDAGWEQRVDRGFALAEYLERRVRREERETGRFVLAVPRSGANVCFWYVPPGLRPFDVRSAGAEARARLAGVAPALKRRMQEGGDALVGYQPLGELPAFFRMVFASGWNVDESDLDALLERMDAIGRDL
ncbi:unnamed protein product [Pedinophyceae sp. YPF-701]|nr:unnamed protein product [Pedinophyceae sp. YPF-701]